MISVTLSGARCVALATTRRVASYHTTVHTYTRAVYMCATHPTPTSRLVASSHVTSCKAAPHQHTRALFFLVLCFVSFFPSVPERMTFYPRHTLRVAPPPPQAGRPASCTTSRRGRCSSWPLSSTASPLPPPPPPPPPPPASASSGGGTPGRGAESTPRPRHRGRPPAAATSLGPSAAAAAAAARMGVRGRRRRRTRMSASSPTTTTSGALSTATCSSSRKRKKMRRAQSSTSRSNEGGGGK